MAEQIALQEPKEGTTSTVTIVESDDHDATQKMFGVSRATFFNTNIGKCARSRIRFLRTGKTFENSPLDGIRILDLTRIVAGPYCTMILSDLGAEVIKVERPGSGDEARKWGPPFIKNTQETCYFMSLNRNKKSICIDIKSPTGRDIMYDLAKESDVLVENYVPGKLDKLQLGYKDFEKVAPHLIYCSITGYGSVGPYKNRPGYDVIAASIGGLLHITGPKGGEPVKTGVAVTDLATGLYAHGAIMAALLQRSRTGKGQKIDCDLLSTQVASLINIGSNYLNTGKEATRWGTAHESIVPYEAFPTRDGYYTVGTGSDLQYKDLCAKLGHPELAEEQKYVNNKSRVAHREELTTILKSIFKTKTNKQWDKIFEGSSFPCGPVNSLKETFNDPHIQAIGLVQTIEHPIAGDVRVVGPCVTYSGGDNCIRDPPPTLGQHTTETLKNILGYSDEQATVPSVTLKLRKPKTDRKVKWTSTTVDNEHMNKKKSKCCCVYEKPTKFGESSSDDSDEECEHCRGHVEKKKKNKSPVAEGDGGCSSIQSEPSKSVTIEN